jgi:hypothetical protein
MHSLYLLLSVPGVIQAGCEPVYIFYLSNSSRAKYKFIGLSNQLSGFPVGKYSGVYNFGHQVLTTVTCHLGCKIWSYPVLPRGTWLGLWIRSLTCTVCTGCMATMKLVVHAELIDCMNQTIERTLRPVAVNIPAVLHVHRLLSSSVLTATTSLTRGIWENCWCGFPSFTPELAADVNSSVFAELS